MSVLILHVWTKDPWKTPWAIHVDDSPVRLFKHVRIVCVGQTREESHTPCANWYLEFRNAELAIDVADPLVATILRDYTNDDAP